MLKHYYEVTQQDVATNDAQLYGYLYAYEVLGDTALAYLEYGATSEPGWRKFIAVTGAKRVCEIYASTGLVSCEPYDRWECRMINDVKEWYKAQNPTVTFAEEY